MARKRTHQLARLYIVRLLMFCLVIIPIQMLLAVFAQTARAQATPAATCPFSDPTRCASWQNYQNARAQVYPPINASTVTSVPVPCSASGASLGGVNCSDGSNGSPGFYTTVENAARRVLAVRNSAIYRGSQPNPVGGFNTLAGSPVCNIAAGEIVHNWLPPTDSAYGCGSMCGITISTGMLSVTVATDDQAGDCDWEYGQYRGTVVQIQNYFKEQVFKEVQSGTINLTNVGGAYPCQELAADVIQMGQGVNNTTQFIVNGLGGPSGAAAATCPAYLPPGASGALGGSGAVAQSANDPTSIAACHMANANMHQFSIWGKLLECEIFWRAGNVVENQFATPDQFVNGIKSYIQPLCQEAGSCQLNGVSQCSGPLCCTDALRTSLFRACYKLNVPPYLQKMMQQWPTTTPVELPKGVPNPTTGQHNALGVGVALGALARARRRRGFARWRRRASVVVLLLPALALAVFGAGCGCDDNNASCKPCIPASQQTQGCLYKACMEGLFLCTQKKQGDVGGKTTATIVSTSNADKLSDGGGFNLGYMFTDLVGAGHDDINCMTPSPTATFNPQILTVFSNPSLPCWVHPSLEFVNEISSDSKGTNNGKTDGSLIGGLLLGPIGQAIGDTVSNNSQNANDSTTFYSAHGLVEVGLNTARQTCRQLAGMPKTSSADNKNFNATASNMNMSALSPAQQQIFTTALAQMAQTDQVGTPVSTGASGASGTVSAASNTAADPTCTHSNPTTTQAPLGPQNSSPAASDLADARGLFGATPVASKSPSATGGGTGLATNAATAGGLPPGAAGGPTGDGGSTSNGAGPVARSPMVTGAGNTAGFAPGAPFGMGAAVPTADGSGLAAGSSGGVLGAPTDFASVAATAGGRGGVKAVGADIGGGSATGGVGGVNFDGKSDAANGVTDANGIIKDTKVSLFVIVNRRTDKFAHTNGL